MNERVLIGGHHIVVVRSVGPDPRGNFDNMPYHGVNRQDQHLVFCTWCGLRGRYGVSAGLSDYESAKVIAAKALSAFADPSCEGVRLELLARQVMET